MYGSFCLTRCVTRNGGCRRVAAAAASLHAWHDHTTSSTQSSLRSSSRRRAGTAFTASVRFSGASSGARAAGAGAPRFPSLHRHVVLHSATPVNLLTSAGVQDDGGAPPRSYASVSTPVPAGAVRRAGGRAGGHGRACARHSAGWRAAALVPASPHAAPISVAAPACALTGASAQGDGEAPLRLVRVRCTPDPDRSCSAQHRHVDVDARH